MGTGQEETGRTDLASRAPESSTGRRLTSRPNTFLSAFPLFALDFYNFLAVFLPSVQSLLPNGSRNKKCVTSPFKLTGRSPFFQHSRDFPQEFYFVGQVNSAIPNCPSNRQTFNNHNESKPKIHVSWEKIKVFFRHCQIFPSPAQIWAPDWHHHDRKKLKCSVFICHIGLIENDLMALSMPFSMFVVRNKSS